MKKNCVLLADECFRVSRVSSNASEVTLRAEHLPTGLACERSIVFAEESEARRLLLSELVSDVERRYPAQDFIIEHLWLGAGHGGELIIRHLPTGFSVQRNVGYDPKNPHIRELLTELFKNLTN